MTAVTPLPPVKPSIIPSGNHCNYPSLRDLPLFVCSNRRYLKQSDIFIFSFYSPADIYQLLPPLLIEEVLNLISLIFVVVVADN